MIRSVFQVALMLLNVLVRPDYRDFRKSCRVQNFCHKLLIVQVLESLSQGKAGVKGTLLVPPFRPAT